MCRGVRYIEVRFAPQLFVTTQLGVREIVRRATGLSAGAKAHNATRGVKSGEDVPFHFDHPVRDAALQGLFLISQTSFGSWNMRQRMNFGAAS